MLLEASVWVGLGEKWAANGSMGRREDVEDDLLRDERCRRSLEVDS